ncbi:MAG TPA: hypothetical protein VI958_09120, partial [Acidobacteriota bacterium]
MKPGLLAFFAMFCCCSMLNAQAPSDAAVQELKLQLEALKADYEKRIADLETRLDQLQLQVAEEPEAAVVAPPPQQTIPGALNPA